MRSLDEEIAEWAAFCPVEANEVAPYAISYLKACVAHLMAITRRMRMGVDLNED